MKGYLKMHIPMHERHLNGWKEIGCYLGRVVRTAQRWETQLGMPVHRPATRMRTAVIAVPHELDAWLVRNRSRLETYELGAANGSTTDIAALGEKLARLQTEATQLALEIQRARGEAPQLPQTNATDLVALPERSD